MKTSTKVGVALGLGLVVGGILGIMYAPAKGAETREIWSRNRRNWRTRFERGVKKGRTVLSKMPERFDEEMGE